MQSQIKLFLSLLLLVPLMAQAHPLHGPVGGFFSCFLHPLTGLGHIAAMVAVGIWGAFLGAPAMWLLPVIFPLVMAAGGALAFPGFRCPAWKSPLRCRAWFSA